jgi:TATA-box binding protein (TBP) (component of TFIID and TFIIIB)
VNIVNVVATVNLDQKVDLDKLGQTKEILHDSEIYGGRVAYYTSSTTKGRVSIFTSGKMISVGTKSEEDAFQDLKHAKEFLVKKGFIKPTTLKEKKVQNIVVTADLEEKADLEEITQKYKMIYEPD